MTLRFFFNGAAIGLTGILALGLTGCGGGGGSSVSATPPAAVRSISGLVQAPTSQTRSVTASAVSDPVINIPGATVTLYNLDNNSTPGGTVLDTATTGADGKYAFPSSGKTYTVMPGTNYKIEATKSFGSKQLTLKAIVTPAADSQVKDSPHDLTPNSTVAAVAIIQQLTALRAADPTAKSIDLQKLADDLQKRRDDSNTPPVDCTNPDAVTNDANTLKQAAAPKGSYYGTAVVTTVAAGNTNDKVGDKIPLAAQVDASGHIFLVAIAQSGSKTTAAATTTTGGTNSGDNGDNGDNFALGSVTADGLVNATTKNGQVKLTGIFTSGAATGTWQQTDGSAKGTWTLGFLSKTYSGLYAGKYTVTHASSGNGGNGTGSGTGSGNGGTGGVSIGISSTGSGDFALVVLDDNTALIYGAGVNSGSSLSGAGTISGSGVLTFTINSNGSVITGAGQINPDTHSATGTLTGTKGEAGTFFGRANNADNSDL